MLALLHAADLAPLAPHTLVSFCQERYRGEDMDIPLAAFDAPSQHTLVQLYTLLQAIRELLDPVHAPPPAFPALNQLLSQQDWDTAVTALRHLALRPDAQVDTVRAAQVIHDLRGGALQALVMFLQLGTLGLLAEADLLRLWFLTRDQLKIFRNAVGGIDPAGLEHDLAERRHSAALIVEKWQRATHALPDRRATVRVDSAFDGDIAERCLEFAALDRVLYNLINNACRHAADDKVTLALLPVGGDQPVHLRIGVANRVSPEQRERLCDLVGGDLGRLFAGGLTTSGSGEGLRICADFVLNAYGQPSLAEALAGGYLGISLTDDRFLVWAHWPIAGA